MSLPPASPSPSPAPAPAAAPAQAAPAVSGGPADITAQLPAATPPAAPPAEPPKPVIVGDRSFASTEEALAYANSIARSQAAPPTPAPAPMPQPPAQPKVGELLFEDPEAALKLHAQQIEDRIEQRSRLKKAESDLWENFYREHPDLKGFEDVLEFQKAKHWGSIAAQPVTQSLPFLAKEARSYLSKIRGNAGPTERLPAGPAMVAGASGTPPPPTPALNTKPMSFIDEVKSLRKGKTK